MRERISWTEQEFDGLIQARKKEAHELLKELLAMEATLEFEICEPLVAHTSPTAVAREDQPMVETGPSGSGGIPHLIGAQFSQEGEAQLENIKASTPRFVRKKKTTGLTPEEMPEVTPSKWPSHGTL